MIASDEKCRYRRRLLTAVVLIKRPELLVLVRHGHAFQIVQVSHGLEIAATNQQINFHLLHHLQVRDRGVYRIELAVTAPFDRDLHRDVVTPTARAFRRRNTRMSVRVVPGFAWDKRGTSSLQRSQEDDLNRACAYSIAITIF